MRARRVPAGAAQLDVDRVGGAGDRPLAEADGADVDGRVAVEHVDRVGVLEHAVLDREQRPAGHDLLGRLEHQPHPCRQPLAEVGQGQARAEQRRRVHVVPAGVRDAGDGAAPRVVGPVVDRQRVEVGPEDDDGPGLGPDLRDQPGALERSGRDAGVGEPLGDDAGGALLGPRQLGVGVQVAADVDHLGLEPRERVVERRTECPVG